MQPGNLTDLPRIPGFEAVREIGRGGMGTVVLARQPSLDRLVALKFLRSVPGAEEEMSARFNREARTAALTHPHIVPVYDYGSDSGTLYICMAFMPGGSLRTQLSGGRRLSPGQAVGVALQIASALSYAHGKGVVHRDIKPSNILLDEDGNAYLSDFGVALIAEVTRLTGPLQSVGTAEYMAPELATGSPASPATDIYALGVALYQSLAAKLPFSGEDPQIVLYQHRFEPVPGLPPDVPDGLASVVRKALEKDPAARYRSAVEFGEALASAATPEVLTPGRGGSDPGIEAPFSPMPMPIRRGADLLDDSGSERTRIDPIGPLADPTDESEARAGWWVRLRGRASRVKTVRSARDLAVQAQPSTEEVGVGGVHAAPPEDGSRAMGTDVVLGGSVVPPGLEEPSAPVEPEPEPEPAPPRSRALMHRRAIPLAGAVGVICVLLLVAALSAEHPTGIGPPVVRSPAVGQPADASTGPAQDLREPLPDVVGLRRGRAIQELRRAGFAVKVRQLESRRQGVDGEVMRVRRAAGNNAVIFVGQYVPPKPPTPPSGSTTGSGTGNSTGSSTGSAGDGNGNGSGNGNGHGNGNDCKPIC